MDAYSPPSGREQLHATAQRLSAVFAGRDLVNRLADARRAIAGRLVFTRPVPARNWLQASNPSERWKWDFLYQDLPPVKGHNVQMEGISPPAAYIPLKPV